MSSGSVSKCKDVAPYTYVHVLSRIFLTGTKVIEHSLMNTSEHKIMLFVAFGFRATENVVHSVIRGLFAW